VRNAVRACPVNESGKPIPAIFRVHIRNGNEWPEVYKDEGVVLDDFRFPTPVVW